MFYGCTMPPDSVKTKFGSSNQEASPSAGKNTRGVLKSCHAWKCVPTAISGISGGVIYYDRCLFSEIH